MKNNSGIASQLQQLAWLHINDGNFADAMKNLKKALFISKRLGDKKKIAGVLRAISTVLEQKGDDNKSLKYQIEAKETYSQIGNKFFEAITSRNIGITYEKIGKSVVQIACPSVPSPGKWISDFFGEKSSTIF